MGADAERVDRVALAVQRVQNVLVDVVAGHDGGPLEAVDLELGADALEEGAHLQRQVGQVARVQANAPGLVAQVVEGERHGAKVRHARLEHVVRVDQGEEVGREGEGEGGEGGQLALVALALQKVQVGRLLQFGQVALRQGGQVHHLACLETLALLSELTSQIYVDSGKDS